MAIQTKEAEGIACELCDQRIEGKFPVETLPHKGLEKALPAALAYRCRHCEIFLCKECYTKEQGKLRGLKKMRGLDCPRCGSKLDKPKLCIYPANLDLDAVVARPSDRKRTQAIVQTETAKGIICKACGQPIEGKITVEPLSFQEANIAFPAVIGLKCQYCTTFLCKECYVNAKREISGLKTLAGVGIDCPSCSLQFYSILGVNLGIYPLEVNLNKLEEFDKLLGDLGGKSSELEDLDEESCREDLLMRIKEHAQHLAIHIRENTESRDMKGYLKRETLTNLITIGRARADWLLRKDVISDDVVNNIVEITQTNSKKRPIAALALIEIEVARKDSHLVPNIIEAQDPRWFYTIAVVTLMGRITWDERIVDYLIDQLEDKWEVPDPSSTSFFDDTVIPAAAQFAAESLIAIGDERGVSAATQRVFKYISGKHEFEKKYAKMIDWCTQHGSTLVPHIAEGLRDEKPYVRRFAIQVLAQIDDSNLVGVLSSLENDPDKRVRSLAQTAVRRLQGNQHGSPHERS